MKPFFLKGLLALISIVMAGIAWLGTTIIIEYSGLVYWLNKVIRRYNLMFESWLSFGLLAILFYTVLLRLTGTTELPKPPGHRLGRAAVRFIMAVLSTVCAYAIWYGLFSLADYVVSREAGFYLSPFRVVGWILFGILSIVIYSFMTKLQQEG